MGVRRKSRARLANVQREGIDKKAEILVEHGSTTSDIGPAVVSMDQQRAGQIVTTDLVLDLAASGLTLKNQATASLSTIGTSTDTHSWICRVTDSVFGIVTSIESVTLEEISCSAGTDYEIVFGEHTTNGSLGSGSRDLTPTSGSTPLKTIKAAGYHGFKSYDNQELKNKYIYLVTTAASNTRAECEIDCTNVTLGNLVGSMNAIQMKAGALGTTDVNFVFTTSSNYDGSAVAGHIGINNANTAAKLATGIATGITNHASFTATVVDSTKVKVQKAGTITQYENTSNTLVEGYSASGITISDFTGGIPQNITTGKILLRFTGHIVPDDL